MINQLIKLTLNFIWSCCKIFKNCCIEIYNSFVMLYHDFNTIVLKKFSSVYFRIWSTGNHIYIYMANNMFLQMVLILLLHNYILAEDGDMRSSKYTINFLAFLKLFSSIQKI